MWRGIGMFGVILILGCGESGPRRAEVTGIVKLDGKDIEEGAIQFIPVEGNKGPSAGGEIRQGKYVISRAQGPVVGKNRVELRATRKTGKKIQDPTGKPGTLIDETGEAFPPEYNEKSTLVRDVQAGSNTFDFELKSNK